MKYYVQKHSTKTLPFLQTNSQTVFALNLSCQENKQRILIPLFILLTTLSVKEKHIINSITITLLFFGIYILYYNLTKITKLFYSFQIQNSRRPIKSRICVKDTQSRLGVQPFFFSTSFKLLQRIIFIFHHFHILPSLNLISILTHIHILLCVAECVFTLSM